MKRPPFAARKNGRNLANRLIGDRRGVDTRAALNKRPSFGLGLLAGDGYLNKFLEAFDWMLTKIKKVEEDGTLRMATHRW